uniref:Uncharacterized protein n=1 Tax=Arundo donax TaxID=35708 RepID=A0A0A8YR73_ARUDO
MAGSGARTRWTGDWGRSDRGGVEGGR